MIKDYYKILGIDQKATDAEIKKVFRTLAFKFHPDHNPGDRNADAHFREIREAYNILSDKEKKIRYDLSISHSLFSNYFEGERKNIKHYFYVLCEKDTGYLNEEIKVIFTYSGDGRLFRKPAFKDFFITGLPFVSFRRVLINGAEVRETSLSYIVSPLRTGKLQVEAAGIKIENKSYSTEPFTVVIKENNCYFSKDRIADGVPLKYIMHYESDGGTAQQKTLKIINHTVLIPRSHYANVYHRIGTSMKIIFLFWGMILSIKAGFNVFLGVSGGLLFGGIMCHILYLIMGVKSKFIFARRYSFAREYLDKGYTSGMDTGSSILSSEAVYFIQSLLF